MTEKLSVSFNFSCKCGNKNSKSMMFCNKDDHHFELLCCVCERRYILEVSSKEKPILEKVTNNG